MTPPAVRPAARCFSISMNRITTGMVATRAAANRYCHSIMLKEENWVMPTVMGLLDAVEISTVEIGEMVMNRLKDVDEVAYVRFASVYRSFKDINTFMEELTKLLTEK